MTEEVQTDADWDEVADVVADYLEGLLDIAQIDGDIEVADDHGRMVVAVGEPGQSSLAALAKPDAVAALQDLTRLAVQAGTDEHVRVALDIAGSRNARVTELSGLVDRAIAKIEAGSDHAPLPPMSSYERKLVHDMIAERGFLSDSEGEGPGRHAVVRAS